MNKLLIVLGFLLMLSAVAGMVYVQRKHALAEDLARAKDLLGTRQGKELIARIAAQNPDNAEAQFLLSRQLGLDGDNTEALVKLARAAALGYPEDQVTRQRWLLISISDFPKAQAALESMLAANPDDCDVIMSLAFGYDQLNQSHKSELLTTRILERDPNDGAALCLRGKIRLRGNDTTKALQDLKNAVKLGKGAWYYYAARMYLAECLEKLNDIGRACALFKECKTERPEDAKAQLRYGKCAKYLEQFDEALEAFGKVLEVQPGDVDALLEMADVYVFKKEHDKALEILDRVETAFPNDPQVLVQKAKIYRLKEEPKKAEVYEARHKKWIHEAEERQKSKKAAPAQLPTNNKGERGS